VAGSDISRTAVEAARQILPGVDLRCAGIESLTTSEPFDVVTCFDVLEHVADPDAALEVLKSMLRPQGILAVVVPVYDTLAGALVRLADRDPTHRWKEGRRFWREKLASHGFVLVADHGLWRFGGCGLPYLFWGGARWRGFSPAILLIGARP
jgi:trans-aconitate methyltransferase